MIQSSVAALVGVVAGLCPSGAAAQERGYEWGWRMHPMGACGESGGAIRAG